MKIYNFGSINIDHVYAVDEFVQPGQTIACRNYQRFFGGKGSNQSIALARAGAEVVHVGEIGSDGGWIKQRLADEGIDVSLVSTCEEPTGHALIQVNRAGENSIIVHGGANQRLNEREIQVALKSCAKGELVLTQNETSGVEFLLKTAGELGLYTVFNPAPVTEAVNHLPLEHVKMFVVNETEGSALAGAGSPDDILDGMRRRFPTAEIVLTLGKRGAVYWDGNCETRIQSEKVDTVDTTAAGDTFIGYFLAELLKKSDLKTCLTRASNAAALCVQRPGAADSIPNRSELER